MSKLTVITGPMFSGKTEELVRRIRRAFYAKKTVQIFIPEIDNRTTRNIKSHLPDVIVEHFTTSIFLDQIRVDTDLIVIDEAQFVHNHNFVKDVEYFLSQDYNILIAGLDTDFENKPFNYMPHLLALADEVVKLTAICMKCQHRDATKTYRKNRTNDNQITVGDVDLYEARCLKCFNEQI